MVRMKTHELIVKLLSKFRAGERRHDLTPRCLGPMGLISVVQGPREHSEPSGVDSDPFPYTASSEKRVIMQS